MHFCDFHLYYAVEHEYIAKTAENLSSIVSCVLHRIKVPEPVTEKSVVEELNKLNKRIKQYICFCLLYRPKPIHCNYQLAHYSGFCRISPTVLIDLHQTYRHSSVPQNTSPRIFGAS